MQKQIIRVFHIALYSAQHVRNDDKPFQAGRNINKECTDDKHDFSWYIHFRNAAEVGSTKSELILGPLE